MSYTQIAKLSVRDVTVSFDCGQADLNQFIQRYALINQKANSSKTYVTTLDRRVVGFYTLTVGSVNYVDSPLRVSKGLARHPIPVMILARLAVDTSHQGKGLGKALLKDALLRTAQASDIAGIRCVLVHAKDESARQWYESFDFEPSPVDPYQMFLLIKDIKAIISH